MKVGLLTFPKSQSYGATLQMYALQQTIQRLGHTVEVIHYHNAYMRAEKHTLKTHENPLRLAGRVGLRRLMHRRMYVKFRQFEKKYVQTYPSRAFSDKTELTALADRYDAVVCGSDQVWNPEITDGDMSFFLDFCSPRTKRISYAPSFGVEELPPEVCAAMRPHLERFSALSIREEAGRRLMKDMVDRPVTLVTDPTFLCDAADWAALEQPHPAAKEEYVLYFTVFRSKALYARCRELAREKGIKMVVVGGNALHKIKNKDPMVEYAVDIGPQEWLYLMRHARYVVTNSFHGTAFSMIFQKDFYVEYPPRIGSRLVQVIEDLGMQSRVVREGIPLTDEAAPHPRAQSTLAAMRERSLQYLAAALE